MDYAYKITTHGRAVMAACMALETPFRITRVTFGSGKIGEDKELADVHELLEYVSEGAVADRAHQDDRLTLTIQYANSVHPEVPAFLLSEFVVYVQDPETGGETDLIYGTLGDYRQPVPAYNPAYPPSVFNFPLEIVLSSELNAYVSAPSGLVTWDDMDRLMYGASVSTIANLAIPAEGWEPDDETGGVYPFRLDISASEITAAMVPVLTIHPASLEAADTCGLCPVAQTLDGILRLYAKAAPDGELLVSLVLLEDVQQRDEIAIPTEGWNSDGEAGAAYPLYIDLVNPTITKDLTPVVTVLPSGLEAAAACGLSPSAQTLNGALRLYAKAIPASPIRASLALIRNASGLIRPGSGAAALPVATAERAGAVKPGPGLNIEPDGTLSVDVASEEDLNDMLSDADT